VRVAEQLKCPIENVIVSGTHSHSAGMSGGAGTRPLGQAGAAPRPQPQGPSPLDDVVIDAVRQAAASLQPARLGFGTGQWIEAEGMLRAKEVLRVSQGASAPENTLSE